MLTSITPKVLQVTMLLQMYPLIELSPLKSKISKRRFQVSRLGGKAICGDDPFYDDYYGCEPADSANKNKTKEEKKDTEDWYFSEESALEKKKKKLVKLKNSSLGKMVPNNQQQGPDTTSTAIQWMSNSPPSVQELPEEFKVCNDLSKCKFYTSTYKVNVAVEYDETRRTREQK